MLYGSSKSFIEWLALLPPKHRSRLGASLADRLVNAIGFTGPIETNLGISPDLRVNYPEPRHRSSVFGTPADYLGERGALYLTQALLPHCDTFVDVGANMGYFTFFAKSQAPEKPVHFFEPNPKLFSFIQETNQRNRFKNVTGHRVAVGATSEATRFYLDTQDPGRSSLDNRIGFPDGCEAIDVAMTRFDDFAASLPAKRLLVKVDVENTELDFLKGAENAWDKMAYLIIEVLLPAHKQGFIRKARAASGMHAYYIKDFTLEHSPMGEFRFQPPENNWLLARENPAALRQRLRGSRFTVSG